MEDFFKLIDEELKKDDKWSKLSEKQRRVKFYMATVRMIITLIAIVNILFVKSLLIKYLASAWLIMITIRIIKNSIS